MSKRSKDRQRVWLFSQDLAEFSLNYSSSAPLQGYTQEFFKAKQKIKGWKSDVWMWWQRSLHIVLGL